MNLLTPAQRQAFRDLMRDVHDTFEQKLVKWHRLSSTLNRYGEDNNANAYSVVDLRVQLNYNYMRTWPITFETEAGSLDRQSVQLMVNKQYLSELGYLNANGYFVYDPEHDFFVIDGLKYVPFGDTPVSNFYDDDILFTIILKRDDTQTSDDR